MPSPLTRAGHLHHPQAIGLRTKLVRHEIAEPSSRWGNAAAEVDTSQALHIAIC